jgi:hypothetical protein
MTWKRVLTVVSVVLGPPAAAAMAFFAAITWSDCFIECSGHPQHAKGAVLWLVAALLVLSGPLLAALLVRKASWVAGTIAVPVVEVLLLGLQLH